MEILAEAQKELSTADLNSNIALPDKIITTNNSIPMILVDEEDEIIYANNLDSIKSDFTGRVFLRQDYSTNIIYDDISTLNLW